MSNDPDDDDIVLYCDRFELVVTAAASLPRARRSSFLEAVAARLSAMPTDAEVRAAIAQALG